DRRVVGFDGGREIGGDLREGDDFAFDVEGFVVVVMLVARGDAESSDDNGGVDGNVGGDWIGLDDEIDVRCKRERRAVACDRQGRFVYVGAERADGDGLEVGVVVAGGLEAHAFEASGHVFGGEFVAASS